MPYIGCRRKRYLATTQMFGNRLRTTIACRVFNGDSPIAISKPPNKVLKALSLPKKSYNKKNMGESIGSKKKRKNVSNILQPKQGEPRF